MIGIVRLVVGVGVGEELQIGKVSPSQHAAKGIAEGGGRKGQGVDPAKL